MKEDKPKRGITPDGQSWQTITKVYRHGDENKLGRGTWVLVCNNCYGKAVEKYGPETQGLKGKKFFLNKSEDAIVYYPDLNEGEPICAECFGEDTRYIWWSNKEATCEVGETPKPESNRYIQTMREEWQHPSWKDKPPKEFKQGTDKTWTVISWIFWIAVAVGVVSLIIGAFTDRTPFYGDPSYNSDPYHHPSEGGSAYPFGER